MKRLPILLSLFALVVLSASIAGLGGALKTLVLHLATAQDIRQPLPARSDPMRR